MTASWRRSSLVNNSGKNGPQQRLFAYALKSLARYHEDRVASHKRRLLAPLSGKVLEIGPGIGPNLDYLSPDVEWLGVEPSLPMQRYLKARAGRLGRQIQVVTGYAERLPVADASVDAVISTLVLCSVPDVAAALAEVRRVLKPGGSFVFVEHVRSQHPAWARLQRWGTPVWRCLGDGCSPDRDTVSDLEQAGFGVLSWERFQVPLLLATPHIAGFARR